MISFGNSTVESSGNSIGPVRTHLRRDGWAVLFAAAITMMLELGVFFVARSLGQPTRMAVVATLATVGLWLALAPACLAASGRGAMSSLLRGGIVADATGASVLVVWLVVGAGGGMGFLGAIQVYCVAWSMAMVGVAGAWLARRAFVRQTLAVTTAVLFSLALTSLLWSSAWIGGRPGAYDSTLATWAVRVNPFCALADAVVAQTYFVWQEWGRMYTWTRIGEYVMPDPVPWYETCLLYLAVAAGVSLLALLRYRMERR